MAKSKVPCSPKRVIIRYFPNGKLSASHTKDIELIPGQAPIITRTVQAAGKLSDELQDGRTFLKEGQDRYKFNTQLVQVNFELVPADGDSGEVITNEQEAKKFLS